MARTTVARWAGHHALPIITDESLVIRRGVANDRGLVRRIECACFGRARFFFGLWPRTGRRDVAAWVAEIDGQPGGYLIAYEKEYGGKPVMYVGGVGVLPRFRKRGIGTQLMSAVLTQHLAIWLHVRAGNAAAVEMYSKIGMHKLQHIARFYSNGDDAVVMGTSALLDESETNRA